MGRLYNFASTMDIYLSEKSSIVLYEYLNFLKSSVEKEIMKI